MRAIPAEAVPVAGDWGFFEWRVATIKEVRAGRAGYVSISDGIIETSGSLMDRWRPLTIRNAAVSRYFGGMHDELHREGSSSLNYPRFHDHLVDLWLQACDGDDAATNRAGRFVEDVLRTKQVLSVDGIPLIRQRL